MKAGDLEDRLISFAVRVVNVTESLPAQERETISRASLFAQVHPQHPTMVRPRVRSRVETLFTR